MLDLAVVVIRNANDWVASTKAFIAAILIFTGLMAVVQGLYDGMKTSIVAGFMLGIASCLAGYIGFSLYVVIIIIIGVIILSAPIILDIIKDMGDENGK